MKNAEYWDVLKKDRVKSIIWDSLIWVNEVPGSIYVNALTKAVLGEIAKVEMDEQAYFDELNLVNQMDSDSRPE